MTRKAKHGSKRKKQKQDSINPSSQSVLALLTRCTYKIKAKGGLMVMLPTRDIKPSQRCPQCGAVHKEGGTIKSSSYLSLIVGLKCFVTVGGAMVMYNVAISNQG